MLMQGDKLMQSAAYQQDASMQLAEFSWASCITYEAPGGLWL
jgi:hypothetical protein